MESTKAPPSSVRRHMPRRSTRGPLDEADDPLANPPAAEEAPVTSAPSSHPASRSSLDVAAVEKQPPAIDLHFLQDPDHYVARIPTEDLHEAFLKSESQPGPDVSLQHLLQHGHFRRAAETALAELLESSPSDTARIFALLYTRLACLILITRHDLASHEASPLIDLLARSPTDEIVTLVPWELRLLLVRLQSIVASDGGRRGIMSLYTLAAEVRQHIRHAREAGDEDDVNVWSKRLHDLGMRVGDTLVEMGELETATRHLDSLLGAAESDIAYRKALLRLRLGDIVGGKACVETISDPGKRTSTGALLHAANGDFSKAVEQWQQVEADDSNYALATTNLAVGLLYTGRLAQARGVLEQLLTRLPAFPGALFNLGTVYELCTEQALDRKADLAQRIANKEPQSDTGGWEHVNFEFKL